MANNDEQQSKYEVANAARQACVEEILKCDAPKRVVVAGPGTGKTHLFKAVLKDTKNTLTLSFVNALVDDLSLELLGMSEVRTLHGFARSALATATKSDVKISPKLPYVIHEDATVLIGKDVNFENILHNRDDKNEVLAFYRERRGYYGWYGYTDVIFEAVRFFEEKRELVPKYAQVIVDEYQDFNPLEVSLIDLLSEKSPILLAGDDDQALYAFKSASPEYIRACHDEKKSGYRAFNLPYCGRCTRVVVDATNDVVAAAQKTGLLQGRIDKPFRYFDHKDKDVESDRYSRIFYKQLYAAQMPWFIETQIRGMAEEQRKTFSVLVISATSRQARTLAAALEERGFENVSNAARDSAAPTLLDGLKLLLEDKKSNLGWRIVARSWLGDVDFANVVTKAGMEKSVADFLEPETKAKALRLVGQVKRLSNGDDIGQEELIELAESVDFDLYESAKESLRKELLSGDRKGLGAIRKIPITVTTIPSSKGLAADLVFITHFDDQYFVRDKEKAKISDQDVCNFIVALTRTKQKAFLVSSAQRVPTFLGWIDPKRINRL